MRGEEERDGTFLELDLWYRSPPLTLALTPAQVRDLYPYMHLDFGCVAAFDSIDSPASRLNSVLRQTVVRPLFFVFPLNTIVMVQLPTMNWLQLNSHAKRQHAMFNPQAAFQM